MRRNNEKQHKAGLQTRNIGPLSILLATKDNYYPIPRTGTHTKNIEKETLNPAILLLHSACKQRQCNVYQHVPSDIAQQLFLLLFGWSLDMPIHHSSWAFGMKQVITSCLLSPALSVRKGEGQEIWTELSGVIIPLLNKGQNWPIVLKRIFWAFDS